MRDYNNLMFAADNKFQGYDNISNRYNRETMFSKILQYKQMKWNGKLSLIINNSYQLNNAEYNAFAKASRASNA